MEADDVTSDTDPLRAGGDRFTQILSGWAAVGLIAPEWSVTWIASDGAFRCRFTLLRSWNLPPMHYDLTEAEFSMYVMGATDWARTAAGPAAEQLADEERGNW